MKPSTHHLILRSSKGEEEILLEKQKLSKETITYFDVDTQVAPAVLEAYALNFKNYFPFGLSRRVTSAITITVLNYSTGFMTRGFYP